MTVPGNIDALLLGGQRGYQIERSLRFNNADSAYLSKGSTLSGNRRLHTLSFWVKRAGLGSRQTLFGNTNSSGNGGLYFEFDGNDALLIGDYTTGWVWQLNTTARYRDPSAWYHIVFAVDTANATASNRARLYVNNIEVTAFSTASYMSQNYDTYWNYNASAIGRLGDYNGQYFSGYLTEIHFIDGQALTPSSFGETDTITGVWKPKKYAGTYGTNGFYLKFADNSGTTSTTLGKDSSGNGNNWTPNNFSVTAGAGNDSLIDTPTPYADGGNGRGNYATLNPLDQITGRSDLSNGNLDISTGSTTNGQARSTLALPSSGKHYFEATVTSGTSASAQINVGLLGQTSTNTGSFVSGMYSLTFDTGRRTVINGTLSSRTGTAASTNDVIQVAVDMSTGNGWVGQNNTWYDSSNGTTGNPATGANPTFTGLSSLILCGFGWTYNNGLVFNFGQRAFAYTPPSGFLALNTQNLPEPSIKKPSSYMDVKLYTGNGGTQTISGLGFSPDFVWIKDRSTSLFSHRLVDSVRGSTRVLFSDATSVEQVDSYGTVGSFTSDGFTLRLGTNVVSADGANANGDAHVAWCWDESATPGFDIVTYTGNGTNRTIAHSLGVAPKMMIVKNRTTAGTSWAVYTEMTGAGNYLRLNSTIASTAGSTFWNSTAPTSSVFSVGTDSDVNANTNDHVAYLWSEVAGFSKFGSYTGNGSSDGPFVFCGFRPRWVMTKRTDTTSNWMIMDAGRNPSNVADNQLYPNRSDAEAGASSSMDLTSNGFKLRNTGSDFNAATATYIFAAFAESAFRYSLAR